ncbi:glutamate-cysteine ligase family protein [Azoarcus sp. KH32C]|uniref:glutamate-cysteine ligase family protein n=1 Tax=Azoarcus sp. KH32C TaxID=748247 RepID=UPI0002386C5A|nr:glutamate-cysteine ligase family protein [Azoarcus sp. KH32C]BAL23862.1 glutamate-cysteine ligase [Azoarcus sp. KH32C]
MKPLHVFAGWGIELEYMIVDRATLAVLPIADELLRRAAGAQVADLERGPYGWSNELVLHLIELKNLRPTGDLAALAAGFQSEIGAMDTLLADLGARLMPTAAHPWMDPGRETRLWPHQNAAIYCSYDRIFDCRHHGWANLQSMHVNLPFADDREFARLHAAVRVLLPLLPALAASSPLAEGRRTAWLDFRMESYRHHPMRVPSLIGRLIPDTAASRAEYEATVLAPMYRDIAPLDTEGVLQHEWLNTRGVMPRFDRNALEIRVIDVQECPQADLAIAAAATAVVRALFDERWSTLAAQQAIATDKLLDLLLRTICDADRAVIDDSAYLALLGYPRSQCRADELWHHLLGACAGDPLLSAAHRDILDRILAEGPLARRILRALGANFDRADLQAVYRQLCDCLAEGRLFAGAGS